MREAFVGVSNEQPLSICACVGLATMLAQAGVTHHGIYIYKEFVRYMTMYTMCLSYKGILYLECWPNVLFHSIVVGVEHCI